MDNLSCQDDKQRSQQQYFGNMSPQKKLISNLENEQKDDLDEVVKNLQNKSALKIGKEKLQDQKGSRVN